MAALTWKFSVPLRGRDRRDSRMTFLSSHRCLAGKGRKELGLKAEPNLPSCPAPDVPSMPTAQQQDNTRCPRLVTSPSTSWKTPRRDTLGQGRAEALCACKWKEPSKQHRPIKPAQSTYNSLRPRTALPYPDLWSLGHRHVAQLGFGSQAKLMNTG